MTLDDIQKRLDGVKRLCVRGDDESAREDETGLYVELLEFLAQRDDEVGALCKLAVQAHRI